jgi:hypothetical protein
MPLIVINPCTFDDYIMAFHFFLEEEHAIAVEAKAHAQEAFEIAARAEAETQKAFQKASKAATKTQSDAGEAFRAAEDLRDSAFDTSWNRHSTSRQRLRRNETNWRLISNSFTRRTRQHKKRRRTRRWLSLTR